MRVFMLKVTYDILYKQGKEPVNVVPKVISKGIEYVEIMGD